MAQRSSFNGGFRLFHVAGITVFLHWSWFLVAFYELRPSNGQGYSELTLPALEYLTLFAIVLVHEFGHSLACRSVGGKSDRILLWPFGGVSFVQPPPRPGAVLWSIAAGPLVNVVLIPITLAALWFVVPHDGSFFTTAWDAMRGALPLSPLGEYVKTITEINLGLLIFNMLPIYPLDGGQILRSVLWFFVGAALSLQIATIIGVIGAAAVLILAIKIGSTWLVILALMGAFQCWTGFQYARQLRRIERTPPKRTQFACPQCGAMPPAGDFWQCTCGRTFDLFGSGFACPHCGRQHPQAQCGACGTTAPAQAWIPHRPIGYGTSPSATPTSAP